MITEDYVSFEIAKLLKEKGFNEPCTYLWIFEKTNNLDVDANGIYKCPLKRYMESDYCNNTSIELLKKEDEYWNDNTDIFTCPTLQMAIKWLREVHNLSVEVYRTACGYIGCIVAIPSGTDIKFLEDDGDDLPSGQYTTFEKACEATVQYCLKNLI